MWELKVEYAGGRVEVWPFKTETGAVETFDRLRQQGWHPEPSSELSSLTLSDQASHVVRTVMF